MELIVKKTNEFSTTEISAYCNCFERVFGRVKDSKTFQTEFNNSSVGYSIHSLLLEDDGRVVGGYTAMPMLYEVNGVDRLFAFGVDLMIDEGYRDDVSNLLKIIKAIDKALKELGVICFYGFPNDNSYKVNLAFIKMKDVCSLYTYILPWKIGAVKPSLKLFNPFSVLYTKLMILCSKIHRDKKIVDNAIHKKQPDFDNRRYLWFKNDEYRHYQDEKMSCHWKVSNYEGTEAAFLMDVYPMSKSNFDMAVSIVYNNCKKKVGLLLYVGYLPFNPCSMIKVPMKLAPKSFHFVAKILDKTVLTSAMVYNGYNWDVNLASYDLL